MVVLAEKDQTKMLKSNIWLVFRNHRRVKLRRVVWVWHHNRQHVNKPYIPSNAKKKSKQTSSEKKIIPLTLGFFSSLFGSQLPTFKA